MTRQDQENDPSSPPQADSAEGVPRAAFDPPIENPAVVALLKGLKPSVTPEPMQVAATDGEISASFAGGPRPLPPGHKDAETADGPNVVVDLKAAPVKKADPDKLDTTFRIRGRRRALTLPLAVLVLVMGGGIAAWLGRTTATGETRAQPSALPRVNASGPQTRPTRVPDVPPPPPIDTSAATEAPPASASAPSPATPTKPPTTRPGRNPTKGSDELPSVL
jgi:hypothetical protein